MKKSIAKVSAIIITHNRCGLLRRAINSVLHQTYKNIEIIVVDDASEDETEKYGNKLLKNGIKYIRIEKNESKGGNHARNVGIINSTGEYIAFLDDDDYWLPQKTEIQVKYLEEHNYIGMVYSGLFFEYDNHLYDCPRSPNKNAFGNIVEKQMYYAPFCTTITMMLRKSLLDIVEGFDINVRYWQEYELSLRIIQYSEIGVVYKPLAVANRSIKVNRLTNRFEEWRESVRYIDNKHKELFKSLSYENKRKKKELYYKEAAYRASMCGDKKRMKYYYLCANRINRKIEYIIRAVFDLSKNDTILFESIIMKYIYIKNKNRRSLP